MSTKFTTSMSNGRIRLNPSSGSLDVDCNGAGAGFVMAESEYTLEELGDLVYPNPSCAKLVTIQLQSLPKDDQPLFAFQIKATKPKMLSWPVVQRNH
ncbi:unnamed protein product [Brassica napus]|uniref:(rape) hypothetical protein n=1 Tax=Brassica napus TaxID=3708 RepID=A0A816M0Z0_BRANA|nr:unnamed protein product [Brassica napus]